MENSDKILLELKKGILALAKENLVAYGKSAVADAENIFERQKTELKKSLEMLEKGEINIEEFEEVMKGRQSLWEMHALAKKAEAKMAIENFRDGVLNLLLKSGKLLLRV